MSGLEELAEALERAAAQPTNIVDPPFDSVTVNLKPETWARIAAAIRAADVARDLVALWRNPRIKSLARSERNGAIEETRTRLIEAVGKMPGE